MRKPMSVLGAMAAVAMLAASCSGADGSESEAITITSPEDGASVGQSFTLKFDAGDIGETDTGKDHVHVYVDGEESDYEVVTKSSYVVKGLSNGEHTITVTKQHADHSPTGDEAELTVDVSGGGSTDDSDDSGDDGGGGYGY